MEKTRREFLATAALAPILSPMILSRSNKSGTKAPVLGSGAHQYEAIHDWGELPPQIKWGNTHAVVEDSERNIYVHHTVHATSDSADSIVVFDRNGKFVRSWGKEFRGIAHGLHIRKEGRDDFLYLTLNAANPRMSPAPAVHAAVIKATRRGEIVWTIAGPPDIEAYKPAADGTPKRYNPTNVATITSATPTRRTGTVRSARSRASRSSPGNSSAHTAPASIATATYSLPSGWRWAVSRSCAKSPDQLP